MDTGCFFTLVTALFVPNISTGVILLASFYHSDIKCLLTVEMKLRCVLQLV